jgi:Tfp pilus assembly protein PilE
MMKRKNFTLIEILGVCALIAILGIIGFGSYTFAMNKSKESATQALLKQIEAGLANVKQELLERQGNLNGKTSHNLSVGIIGLTNLTTGNYLRQVLLSSTSHPNATIAFVIQFCCNLL